MLRESGQWLPWTVMILCTSWITMGNGLGLNDIPDFSSNQAKNVFEVKENAPVGSILGWVELKNGPQLELEPRNDVIKFERDDGKSNTNRLRMNVLLNKALDFDQGPSLISINIVGSNAKQGLTFVIYILIADVNDELPIFVNLPYSVTVREDHKIGNVSYSSIKAIDKDKNDSQIYSMESVDSNDPFSIDPYSGQLQLKEGLDYENDRFFHYNLTVKDRVGHSGNADLFITIEDVQDTPPYFGSPAYHAQVEENEPKRHEVLQVRAWDGDKGVSNSISYGLAYESCPGVFGVDPTTGLIALKESPDRDRGTIHQHGGNCDLRVVATEGNEYPQVRGNFTTESVVTISITDVNDNGPVFSQAEYQADVDENTQQDMPISLHTKLRVTDIDQGANAKFQVEVTSLQCCFEAEPSIVQSVGDISIKIKNSSILDFEEHQKPLTIKLTAFDLPNKFRHEAVIHLTINNVNDNIPEFEEHSYHAKINEESPAGTHVIVVKADDKDVSNGGNAFGTVTYSIENDDKSFQINPKSGEVKTSQIFDRETRDVYFLTIVAEDGGKLKTSTTLTVHILDVNDNPPVFVTNQYQSSLQENSVDLNNPIVVSARDKDDEDTQNAVVYYKLLSSNPQNLVRHFSMSRTGGNLTVEQSLDYEAITFGHGSPGMIELVVAAFDGGNPSLTSTTTIFISLLDVNDHDPAFQKSEYFKTIPENITQGTHFMSLSAQDQDAVQPNNIYFFSLDYDSLSTFSINSQTGQISTVAPIDRETTPSYIITGYVADRGLPSRNSSCVVHVTVSDVNDEIPQFVKDREEQQTYENKIVSWSCQASDTDTDSKLVYSIDWDKSSGQDGAGSVISTKDLQTWMEIESDRCFIKSKKPLDREKVNKITLQVQVKDTKGQLHAPQIGTATWYIEVLDVNDEAPSFEGGPVFSASVRENTPKGNTIYLDDGSGLTVVDKDERGINSDFNVVLLNHTDIFKITPGSGESRQAIKIEVIKDGALDYEKVQNYTLELVARESLTGKKLSSTASVIITVLNENDNTPEFLHAPFTAWVPENSKIGTSVTSIEAEDHDLPPFGYISFSIEDEALRKKFHIGAYTGLVTVASSGLNRETDPSFSMPVSVTDNKGFSSRTQLTVFLSDENDNDPHFDKSSYSVSINENQDEFNPVFGVHATDGDEPGNKNSNLTYSLSFVPVSLQHNISIEPQSGEILLNNPLDFESLGKELGISGGKITLTVTVRDGGIPSRKDSAQVVITVLDENDHSPVFNKAAYTGTVLENAVYGFPIAEVKAHDYDSTKNQVSYRIDTLSADTFKINETSGKIFLTGKLDRESKERYSIAVTAIDNGEPSRTATAKVNVKVTDINDEVPQFTKDREERQTYENKIVSWPCQASDPDTDSKLVYSIDWDKSSGQDGAGSVISTKNLQTWMEIEKDKCIIKSKKPLDREKVNKMTLQIQVTDTKGQLHTPQIGTATRYIEVLDVNDEAPSFEGGSVFSASVRENTPKGNQIYLDNGSGLTVVDKDERGNNTDFNVVLLNHIDIFKITPGSGESRQAIKIEVIKDGALDYEKVQNYTLELVAAEFRTSKKLSSTATVIITVLNENDNTPEFLHAPFTAWVPENSKIGTSVTIIEAEDHDLPPYGNTSYSIEDETLSKLFHINADTGLVTVAEKDLNRETNPSFSMPVSVTDNKGFSSRTQLTVFLSDENDNDPHFDQSTYGVSIKEDQDEFNSPFLVHATDGDEPGNKNSNLTYSLSFVPVSLQHIISIEPQSGEILLNNPLDFESLGKERGISGGKITLAVTVRDGGIPSRNDSAQVIITVLDQNDHSPVFDKATYSGTVSENAAHGSPIAHVKARDYDSTSNLVSYRIDTLSADTFKINETSGKIFLTGKLDRESKDRYSIAVTAIDNGEPSRTATAQVNVKVTDINDEVPQFTEDREERQTYENKIVSWSCQASDPDTDPKLVYSIDWDKSSGQDGAGSVISTNDLQAWMEIERDSCLVKSKKPLDREKVNKMTLQIEVTDTKGQLNTPQIGTATWYINVLDVNDETPSFEGGPVFSASVRENTPKGNQIYLDNGSGLTVVDKDERGNNSDFNVVLLNHVDIFKITPASGESRQAIKIEVIKDGALDYEKVQNYTLELVARESHTSEKLSTSATVIITVLNENDNTPEFLHAPFTAWVPENSKIDTSVTTIEAEDHDLPPYGYISFSIEDETLRKIFHIDANTGLVTVASSGLNRETDPSFSMPVSVTDNKGFSSRTQLTVFLSDENDNDPRFDQSTYGVLIKENQDAFNPAFHVHATDGDEPGNKNSNLTYSLSFVPVSLQHNISIEPQSGEILLNNPLDFESLGKERGISGGKIALTVTVRDGGIPSRNDSAQVVITVLDENDHSPVFDKATYSGTVSENAANGFPIAEVKAHDYDSTKNQVSYRIDTLSADTFKINETSGKIFLTGKLDRESKERYSIAVTAIDNGEPSRTATVQVNVKVTDINDEVPQFKQDREERQTYENKIVSWRCQASDTDTDPKLVYSIDWDKSSGQDGAGSVISTKDLQAWMEIERDSCLVKSKKPLDREKVNKMTLQIEVTDTKGQLHTPQIGTATWYINVLDVNDEAPSFEGGPVFSASVRENTPKGNQIYLDNGSGLTVVDKDERGNNSDFDVVLLNHTDIFKITPGSGESRQAIKVEVIKDGALDYEKVQNYTLELVARESHTSEKLSTSATVIITVLNENDNTPEFLHAPFTAWVPENSKIGTYVTTIEAEDHDLPPYGYISFSIEDETLRKIFSIDANTGLVTVASSGLNREKDPSFSMPVSVTDNKGFSSRTQLTVFLSDENDNDPRFDQSTYGVLIKENQDAFNPPFHVHATDGDEPGNKNSNLTYSLSFVPVSLQHNISIEPQSGEILLNNPLDFESLGKERGISGGKITLTVTVRDGGIPSRNDSAHVVITVMDENDHSPIFDKATYSGTVSENAANGFPIAEVKAHDYDSTKNQVSYRIDTLSADTFKINETSGKIFLTGKLDRESKERYSIAVTAIDNGEPSRTATAQVNVKVTDINDEVPHFTLDREERQTYENKIVSWSCQALDTDTDPKLVYSIDWDKSSGQDGAGSVISTKDLQTWMEIEKDRCLIKSKKPLDREKVNKMTLQIEVTDTKGQLHTPQIGTATWYIEVLDVNDEAPSFEGGPVFSASVRENTPKGNQIYLDDGSGLTVVDKDERGNNSDFNVVLLNHTDTFKITPGSGESRQAIKIEVIKDGALDYEKVQNYTLELVARESHTSEKWSTSATVIITVLNENDNSPEFLHAPFTAWVPENSKIGTLVTTIEAEDHDLPPFGYISFSIEDETLSKIFHINADTGLVTVAEEGLNRETDPSFSMPVSVTDNKGFSSRTQLTVFLSDENDNAPHFDQSTYSVSIKEDQDAFNPPFLVHATDGDEPGNKNSNLTYSLSFVLVSLQHNISIEPQSGEILLNNPLDFESLGKERGISGGKITLTVTVRDGGIPSRNDSAQVVITVLDQNDHSPVFDKATYSGTVSENAANGFLIAEVKARDYDITNNQVSYRIDTLSADTFKINETSGKIFLTGKLDRESKERYSIAVTAIDNGEPSRTATVQVNVKVTDINDEVPQFKKDREERQTYENKIVSWACHASDTDTDPKLVYSIDWDKSSGQDGAGSVISTKDLQTWVEIEGDRCLIQSKKPLDREKVNKMTLQIEVMDTKGQLHTPQIGTATWYIDVLDVNDEAPSFEGGPVFSASVRENTPKGNQIYLDNGSGLTVVDKDERGNNSDFNVVLLNHTDIFKITPGSGESRQAIKIEVIKDGAFDYEKVQNYTLGLVARESHTSEKLSTSATVIITVLNENDNIPKFLRAPFTAWVPENSKIGTSVTTIEAEDHDLPPFGNTSFSIEDAMLCKIFHINVHTGLVTVAEEGLNRETDPSFSMPVSVTDNKGFSSRTQLTVFLSDENDNDPHFDTSSYGVLIKENQDEFNPPFLVHATDGDEPGNKNSNLTYSLSFVPVSLQHNISIEPQSGEILLNNPLDFESLRKERGISGGKVTLTVTVRDGGIPSRNDSTQVVVTVLDQNDHSPVFDKATYSGTVSENATDGFLIAEVKAHDYDSTKNQVSYRIDTLSADTFKINETSGKIFLTGKLDREIKERYSIAVTAIDNGEPSRTATVQVNVKVTDVNDEVPHFTQDREERQTYENKIVSWSCRALDTDTDPKLVYSIDWDKSSGQDGAGSVISTKDLQTWVEIEKDRCLIKSMKPLDREKVNKMTLQIEVTDTKGQLHTPQIGTATWYINVLDVNDEAPSFEGGPVFSASVRENTPKGNQIYLDNGSGLTVVDKDERGNNSDFNVVLLNHTDIFKITPGSGESRQAIKIEIIKDGALDYEKVQNYTLELVVSEPHTSEKFSTTATVIITVLNENDNSPEFLHAPFTAWVPENSKIGTSVTTIEAEDHDLPPFGYISFSIEDETLSKIFHINADTGLVTVAEEGLNRETDPSFSMPVSVTDNKGFSSRTQLTVFLSDENDNAPHFDKSSYSVSIKENLDEFNPPFLIHATDGDEPGNKNSNLTYSLSFVPVSLQHNISIEPQSGEILLNNPLDFESLGKERGISEGKITLTVTVRDGGIPSRNDSVQVIITVLDENDHSPVFDKATYSGTVSENATDGVLIADVKAHDYDSTNNQVSYRIDTLSADTFKINETSGKILLTGKLDRESKDRYSIAVTAIDNGEPTRTATTQVNVKVTDINDEVPKFTRDREEQQTYENKIVSWSCQASDTDTDPKLVYSIDWDKSNGQDGAGSVISTKDLQTWVEIENDTCLIKSKKLLDREEVNKMTLQIQVMDMKGQLHTPQIGTATWYINVLDVNDEAPSFEGGTVFSASVRENTPKGNQIYLDNGSGLTVVDKDERGNNSDFNVVLLNHTDTFKITPGSGESRQAIKIEVIKDDALDYEKVQNYTLELVASESHTSEKLSSTATVIITVLNENDNSPEFLHAPFTAWVPENSKIGTSVTTIKAEDNDLPPFGYISFSIEDETLRKRFHVNADTGLVTVAGSGLNRETDPSFSMPVSVTDNKGFSSRTQLTVFLSDENDNDPHFDQSTYGVSIKENQDAFNPPFLVHATDGDEPGNKNSNLTYSLSFVPVSLQHNISIEPQSGEILLNNPLDFESLGKERGISEGKITLTVTVRDGGIPSRNDSAQVVITVLDQNDNPPLFSNSLYSSSVAENVDKGHSILRLEVHDGDASEPNNVTYCIIQSGGRDRFKIDSSCMITVDQTLDREEVDTYDLTIAAVDRGIPSLTSTTTLHVNVLDVDDTSPTLPEANFEVKIWENETLSTEILEFNATDVDVNSTLTFTLLREASIAIDDKSHVLSYEDVKEWFLVETFEDTGILKVNSCLDRELAQTVVLKIAVTDANAESNFPQVVTATVTVSLMDVNDNPPEFSIKDSPLLLKVSEATQVDTEIKTFTATDADQDETITFSLQQEVNDTYFAITDSGKLTLHQLLDRETTSLINFTVLAVDNGNPPKSSSLPVSVVVLDVNDNDPVFQSSNYTFSVRENSNTSTAVGIVTATDQDVGQNGNVTFYIQDESQFRINKLTGQIFVNGKIDRETGEEILLTISARDNPKLDEPRKASTVITVHVLDENDNDPAFKNERYSSMILETATINKTLSVHPNIEVTDMDKDQNALVSFYFVNDSSSALFGIKEDSGEVYVTQENLIDHAGTYNYVVEARDHGNPPRSSTVVLSITIQDENIHSPQFNPSYKRQLELPECAEPETMITTFNATDQDKNKENNGKVVYSLTGDSLSNVTSLLIIDPETGVLSLIGELDSEDHGELIFQVRAEDKGIPTSRSTQSDDIHLLVKDVNDHDLLFDCGTPSSFEVYENTNVTGKIYVKAIDEDKNSSLQYHLEGDMGHHFDITTETDKTGKISIIKGLDRELTESLTLTVVVKDVSAIQQYDVCRNIKPTKTEGTRNITIHVRDVNDNPPRFTQQELSEGFISTTKYGSPILSVTKYVEDKDTAAVNHHRFVIRDVQANSPVDLRWSPQKNPQPISITSNGTLITNYSFSEDAKGLFRLNVSVYETATGSDTMLLKVYVVSDAQTLHLTHDLTEDKLRTSKESIIKVLSDSKLGYKFVADNILPYSADEGVINGLRSVLVVHAVDAQDNVVDGAVLLEKIDKQLPLINELKRQFSTLKTEVGDSTTLKKDKSTDIKLEYILIVVIALMVLAFAITLFFLVHNIQRFKRKLKAQTIEVHGLDHIQEKFPGLDNTIKDSNPIFMRTDISFDETSLNNPDRSENGSQVSNDSLDHNQVGSLPSYPNSESDQEEQEATVNFYPSSALPRDNKSRNNLNNSSKYLSYINRGFQSNGDVRQTEEEGDGDVIIRTEELILKRVEDEGDRVEEGLNIELDISTLECTDI